MRLTELKQLKPGTEVIVKRGNTAELEMAGYNLDEINPVIGKTAKVIAMFNSFGDTVEVAHPDFPNGSYWLSQSWLEFPKAKPKQSKPKDTYIVMYDGEASESFDDLNDFMVTCSNFFNLDDAVEVNQALSAGDLKVYKLTEVEVKITIPDPVITFNGL
jgi:hypothetical protein